MTEDFWKTWMILSSHSLTKFVHPLLNLMSWQKACALDIYQTVHSYNGCSIC